MIVADEGVEIERITRDRGQHRARSFIAVDLEGVAIIAAPNLELLVSTDEGVVARIDREQHADAASGVGVQDHEVAVLRRFDIDPGALAARELVVIDFDCDRRIGALNGKREC